jgi:hypothetical protein
MRCAQERSFFAASKGEPGKARRAKGEQGGVRKSKEEHERGIYHTVASSWCFRRIKAWTG